jgi:hypothetical protein
LTKYPKTQKNTQLLCANLQLTRYSIIKDQLAFTRRGKAPAAFTLPTTHPPDGQYAVRNLTTRLTRQK